MGGGGRMTMSKIVRQWPLLLRLVLEKRRARPRSHEVNDRGRGAKQRLARLLEREVAKWRPPGQPNGDQ